MASWSVGFGFLLEEEPNIRFMINYVQVVKVKLKESLVLRSGLILRLKYPKATVPGTWKFLVQSSRGLHCVAAQCTSVHNCL
jgi:hypothetical protein